MWPIKRTVAVAAVALGVTLSTAATAFAEDCYNASRSSTGNTAAAANSGVWWSVPEVLADLGGLTPDQIAKVMVVVNADPRVPANFTVFYNPAHPGELASKMNPKNASNGKGIDHSDDAATPVLAAIFQDVAVALG